MKSSFYRVYHLQCRFYELFVQVLNTLRAFVRSCSQSEHNQITSYLVILYCKNYFVLTPKVSLHIIWDRIARCYNKQNPKLLGQ